MTYNLRLTILFIVYSSSFIVLKAQNRTIDSLSKALVAAKNDTNKVNILNALAREEAIAGNFLQADSLCRITMALAGKSNFKGGVEEALNTIGNIDDNTGDYTGALTAYSRALKISKELGDKTEIARNIGNMGIIYYKQGDYPKALECGFTTLNMARQLKNKRIEGNTLSNIGLVYWNQGELDKAISFCDSAITIYAGNHDKGGIARNTGNIGVIYYNKKNYPKALEYLESALKMNEELGRKGGVIRNINNIGNIYTDEDNYDKALEYYTRGLAMATEMDDRSDIAISLGNIGQTYFKQKKYKEAEDYLLRALSQASAIKSLEMIKAFNQQLSDVYAQTGRYQKALETYRVYNSAKDSLVNEDKSKQIGKLEAKADYDKQIALEEADEEKRAVLASAEGRKQNLVIIFIGAVAFAIGFIALTILRSLNITRKQKAEIEAQKVKVEEQKEIVEEKNEEILDSIVYAKRLQDAALPSLSDVTKHLPESFVLYKPKDIVAGDFYWITSLRPKGGILIAACDCTGHGVPGAMVSVVCSNALNRAVKEMGITEPGKILDKVRELVIETFSHKDTFREKSDGEVKDGMDISLASIRYTSEGAALIEWSGANNPLWFVASAKEEMKELFPDKQPVGSYEIMKPFTTHSMGLAKGSVLYLFTDGYADQFGGPKGKKFKYKQLQQLLMDNCKLSMEEQKRILDKTFEEWKGTQEQTDDVCIIGIRIS